MSVAARVAALSAVTTLGLWTWLGWAMTKAGDDPPTIGAVASVSVMVGLPFAVAAAAVAWHIALAMHGCDGAARVLALATSAGYAAITLIASRTMLASERTGILAGVLISVPILLAIGTIAARARRSFRTGLEYGAIALVASLAGILAIALPEAVTWYRTAGIFILDGDSPPHDIAGSADAIRDALTGVTVFYLLFTMPWPVIGAAIGSVRR